MTDLNEHYDTCIHSLITKVTDVIHNAMVMGYKLLPETNQDNSHADTLTEKISKIYTNTPMLDISDIPSDKWSVSQIQQRSCEDRYQAKLIGPFRYFAVFDGHAGTNNMSPIHVADHCVNYLHKRIAMGLVDINLDNEEEVKISLTKTFVDFDTEMHDLNMNFGSTCTMVLIDDVRNKIYQVNLGDSRSILTGYDQDCHMTTIISETIDHEPDNDIESARIVKAGGYVNHGRVNGYLAVARAFGDFSLKKTDKNTYDPVDGMLSAIPDIKIIPSDQVNSIILTSDAPFESNIFDSLSLIERVCRISRSMESTNTDPDNMKKITDKLVKCIGRNTFDDITIIYILNTPQKNDL